MYSLTLQRSGAGVMALCSSISRGAFAEGVPAKDVHGLPAVPATGLAFVQVQVEDSGAKPEPKTECPRLRRELGPAWKDVLPSAGLFRGNGFEAGALGLFR